MKDLNKQGGYLDGLAKAVMMVVVLAVVGGGIAGVVMWEFGSWLISHVHVGWRQ